MKKRLLALCLALLLTTNLSACKPRNQEPPVVEPIPPQEEIPIENPKEPATETPKPSLPQEEKTPEKEEVPKTYPEGEAGEEQKAFDEFIMDQFISSLEENYISIHYTLRYPENYGLDISEAEVSLGDVVNDEYLEEARQNNQEIKEAFEAFNYDLLTAEQQETYQVFAYELEIALESTEGDFPYMAWAFTPMQGLQNQFSSILTEFEFYTVEDVDAYLELMGDIPRYVEDMAQYTRKQYEMDYFMPDIAAENSMAYCETILEAGEDSALLDAILYNIEHCELLNDSQKANYKEEARQLFLEALLPAYQNIYDTLDYCRFKGNNQLGLCHLENGKEYYEFLFREMTGSDLSVEEAKALLEEYLELAIDTIDTFSRNNPETYREYIYGQNQKTDYQSLDDILKDLESMISEDFPYIEPVNYTVSYLDKELAVENVGAYYVVPPLDSMENQTIKVNPWNDNLDTSSIYAFILMAHEGLPGHLYQTNYMMQNLDEPYRQEVSITGYSEGWATYVELLAMEYLDLPRSTIRLEQCQTIFENCLYALCDIGIHYEGWNEEDLEWFLGDYIHTQNAPAIFDQLVAEPAVFQSYYLSSLQFLDLRRDAQNELGGRFDAKEFHEVVLNGGDVPFSVLRQKVDAYVASAKNK